MSNPGQVFTKAQLFDEVWGEDFIGAGNTVMVHIRLLRTKIEEDPSDPQLIKTVWGIGYRFEARDGGAGRMGHSGQPPSNQPSSNQLPSNRSQSERSDWSARPSGRCEA